MAYTDFDPTQPDYSVDAGTASGTDLLNNLAALRDGIISGVFKGYLYEQSGGTADRPATVTLKKGAHWIKHTLTWTDTGSGAYQVTSMLIERSLNSGGAWDTIFTMASTFDGSGNLTATTGGGGWLAKLMQLWGKVTKVIADLATHIAGTGTAVHGLGSISTQSASAAALTGTSTLDGTGGVGQTTAPPVDATRVRETFHDYGAIGNGATVTLELDKYADFAFTPDSVTTSTITIAVSGVPASGKSQTFIFRIVNGRRSADAKITYPATWKWLGGAATRPLDTVLELAGQNIFSCTIKDGSIGDVNHLGKRG